MTELLYFFILIKIAQILILMNQKYILSPWTPSSLQAQPHIFASYANLMMISRIIRIWRLLLEVIK